MYFFFFFHHTDTNVPRPHVCQPGEIRQEYEALLAQQEQERSLQRTEEELASSRLIQQLQVIYLCVCVCCTVYYHGTAYVTMRV